MLFSLGPNIYLSPHSGQNRRLLIKHPSHSFIYIRSAEKPSTPVTLSDWQAQQKAQKDQDRMSKNQTARMLHNYRRGDTDDISSKLSTMKQEDRKKQQEAARLLHNYRGTADGIATKSPKPNEGKHVMPQHVGTVDQRSGEESVASLAAGFNQNGIVENETPVQQEVACSSPESPVMVDSPKDAPPDADRAAPTFVMDVQDNVSAPPAAPDDKPTTTTEEDWISVESSSVPSPEKIEDMLAVEQKRPRSFDSGEDAVTEKADNLDDTDDDEDEPVMTEAQLHASASGGGHVSLRLDVEFSFSLVSNDPTPNTDKYMKAVSAIAYSLFSENRPAGTRGHAIYNPDFEPFIRMVEGEDVYNGQEGTRQIIHASLPMFIIDWADATVTRETIKNILRNSIHDGSLLRLALEGASAKPAY